MIKFSVRDDVERIIKEWVLDRSTLHEVAKTQWESILDNINKNCANTIRHKNESHRIWLRLKEPNISFRLKQDNRNKYIPYIISDKYVWFIIEDTEKFWVYEWDPYTIANVLKESYYINEYYIVSKDYKWIICEDHEYIVYASGNEIIQKINKRKNKKPELFYTQ